MADRYSITAGVQGDDVTARRDRSKDILDAAEALLAEGSFEAVSMRDVAKAAGVPLGLVTYYFTTKDQLFDQVIGRRAGELNARREAALAATDPGVAENVTRAFVEPLLELVFEGGDGWRAYTLLIVKANQSPVLSDVMSRYFNATADKFIEAFARALPNLPYEVCVRGFMMEGTLMLGLLSYRRLDTISHGAVRSADIKAAYRYMLAFSRGGWQALEADFGVGAES